MSEYILKVPDYVPPFDPAVRAVSLGEEIVRCRDCRHYREKDETCHSWQWHNWDAPTEVAADGFCAWGERRDA